MWCFTVVPCVGLCSCLALILWLCQPYTSCSCRNSTLHFTAEAEWQLVLVINYPIISICEEPTASPMSQLHVLCPGSCLWQWGQPEEWLPGGSVIPCPLCGALLRFGLGKGTFGGHWAGQKAGESRHLWEDAAPLVTKIPELSSLWALLNFTVKKKKKELKLSLFFNWEDEL